MNWQRENKELKDRRLTIIRAKDENARTSTITVVIKRQGKG